MPSPPPPVAAPPYPTAILSPATLPDPLYIRNPVLFSHVIHILHTAVGLDPSDRLVLVGILQHIPNTSDSFVSSLVSLPSHQLQSLASIFTAGLLDVKSWGGRRESDEIRGSRQLSTPAYRSLFESLQISPFPPEVIEVKQEVLEDEEDGRQPEQVLHSTTPLHEPPRQQSDGPCLEHQPHRCPITGRSIALDHACLIPHSIAALNESANSLWLLLAICLGPSLRNHVYDVIRDGNSYTTTNTLYLDPTLHRYYDNGVVFLSPDLPDNVFDSTTAGHYDVRFQWRSTPEDLKTWVTSLPVRPEDQPLAPVLQTRPIHDDDCFRLFTNDPGNYPLPHPLLFSLHEMLWRMIGSSGLTGGEHNNHKHIPAAPEPNHMGSKRKRGNFDTNDNAREHPPQRTRLAWGGQDAARDGLGDNGHQMEMLFGRNGGLSHLPKLMGNLAKSLGAAHGWSREDESDSDNDSSSDSDGDSDSSSDSDTDSDTDSDSDSDSDSNSDSDSDSGDGSDSDGGTDTGGGSDSDGGADTGGGSHTWGGGDTKNGSDTAGGSDAGGGSDTGDGSDIGGRSNTDGDGLDTGSETGDGIDTGSDTGDESDAGGI